ncbi:MAG: hypothetical protein HY248_00120 [Fimbriimonas ginsengisoli]|uniref:Uncharacterized protein n=1 Tax=Fimbriimonas ginsengisoli TaxID=1005039 RepID=A0A931LTP3_FIMGI|nr:hypothetical protein [Fimbriimonas ginsengisoli]MBI3720929.1 hypothetical protein [Fimbriimonas ginsengisoli]
MPVRTVRQPTLAAPKPPEGELERFVFDEIQAARTQNRPVSRQMLSQMLAETKGLPPKTCYAVVESYCEAEAPTTPEFLGSEFMVPYMKISALVLAAFGLIALGMSTVRIAWGENVWWWGEALAVVLLLTSASGWIRSLIRERFGSDRS